MRERIAMKMIHLLVFLWPNNKSFYFYWLTVLPFLSFLLWKGPLFSCIVFCIIHFVFSLSISNPIAKLLPDLNSFFSHTFNSLHFPSHFSHSPSSLDYPSMNTWWEKSVSIWKGNFKGRKGGEKQSRQLKMTQTIQQCYQIFFLLLLSWNGIKGEILIQSSYLYYII